MTWHDGSPVDGGMVYYADIGLENVRATQDMRSQVRVLNQAKELGLYLVGLEL